MDNLICKICNQSFPSYASLHKHVSAREKLKIEQYYHKFYPRYDLFSKETIPFKNIDQYFACYFLNRKNLIKWFENNFNSNEAQDLSKILVYNRIKSKNLKFLPSEVELRSSLTPSIIGLEKIHNKSYEDVISYPLKRKFQYQSIKLSEIATNIEIIIDTREQSPFNFKKYKTNLAKLDVGDYTASDNYYSDVYIERKSRDDFFSTFGQTSNFQRFEKELIRANNYGFYLFILVEKDINDCLNYYLQFSSNQYIVEYAFHNLKIVMQKYNNCQFVFAQNKLAAENLCLQILSNKENAIKYDWQYLIDKRII